MKNFTLGKYIPLDSFMHHLDPRAKIISMFILMIAIFIPAGYIGYVPITVIIFAAILASKLKLSLLWNSMKPMFFMLGVLFVINLLVVKTGDLIIQLGPIGIYTNAISQTGYIAIRLVLMIILTTLLTATTKPTDMTVALEDLMNPLKKIGVPANEIAMIISIALRFIPTLIEETQRIMKAQTSRGVDLEEGSLKEKVMAGELPYSELEKYSHIFRTEVRIKNDRLNSNIYSNRYSDKKLETYYNSEVTTQVYTEFVEKFFGHNDFYRVDKARNRNEKRYGLGLAIAKSTVEKYKGTIEVDYKDGYTIFRVKF